MAVYIAQMDSIFACLASDAECVRILLLFVYFALGRAGRGVYTSSIAWLGARGMGRGVRVACLEHRCLHVLIVIDVIVVVESIVRS